MGPVPCGLRAVTIVVMIIETIAVTTAVTWSGEPWPIGRGGVEDGARRGVLCHGCAWRVEGGGVEEMRCCEGRGKEDEGGEGAHGDGWAGGFVARFETVATRGLRMVFVATIEAIGWLTRG